MKNTEYRHIGSALHQLLGELKISNRVHEQKVLETFEKIMGEAFCRRAKAVKIEHGSLFIEVISSVWRQELFYQKLTIRDRINSELKENIVKEIIFR